MFVLVNTLTRFAHPDFNFGQGKRFGLGGRSPRVSNSKIYHAESKMRTAHSHRTRLPPYPLPVPTSLLVSCSLGEAGGSPTPTSLYPERLLCVRTDSIRERLQHAASACCSPGKDAHAHTYTHTLFLSLSLCLSLSHTHTHTCVHTERINSNLWHRKFFKNGTSHAHLSHTHARTCRREQARSVTDGDITRTPQ